MAMAATGPQPLPSLPPPKNDPKIALGLWGPDRVRRQLWMRRTARYAAVPRGQASSECACTRRLSALSPFRAWPAARRERPASHGAPHGRRRPRRTIFRGG